MAKKNVVATKKKNAESSRAKGRPGNKGNPEAVQAEKAKKLAAEGKKKGSAPKESPSAAIESAKPPDSKYLSERVNALVDKLIELQRQQLVDFAFRVGELVVQELFEGDVKLLHQPGPKAKALSRLANHGRLPFSPATLSRSVGVYELVERLPRFRDNKALALGHLYAVLAAPTEQQEPLLTTAVEKSWSVERLLKEVAKAREKELGGKRGRPPLPPGVKALGAVERMFREEAPLHDLGFVEELDKDQAERMKKVVEEMQSWCRQATSLIERRLKVVESPVEEA